MNKRFWGSFVVAVLTREIIEFLTGFSYRIFSDPFDLAKFSIHLAVIIVFAVFYYWLFGKFWNESRVGRD